MPVSEGVGDAVPERLCVSVSVEVDVTVGVKDVLAVVVSVSEGVGDAVLE